jgi:hypothetical protein
MVEQESQRLVDGWVFDQVIIVEEEHNLAGCLVRHYRVCLIHRPRKDMPVSHGLVDGAKVNPVVKIVQFDLAFAPDVQIMYNQQLFIEK